MPRGFCGCCSLYASTVIALTYTLIESSVGLAWNAQLLMILDDKLPGLLSKSINVNFVDDYEVVHGMTLASMGLHILWIVFVLLAFKGNASLTHGLLTPYVVLTYLITLFDIGGTIYFSIKFQEKFVYSEGLYSSSTGEGNASLTYLMITALFSRGGLTWFINVYFAHLVEKRGKEIDENYSALTFYVLSQLSRALKRSDLEQGFSDPPPAYSRSGLPHYILEAGRDRGESRWSLDSNDTLQGIDSNENRPGFINPLYSNTSRGLTAEHRGLLPVYQEPDRQRNGNVL